MEGNVRGKRRGWKGGREKQKAEGGQREREQTSLTELFGVWDRLGFFFSSVLSSQSSTDPKLEGAQRKRQARPSRRTHEHLRKGRCPCSAGCSSETDVLVCARVSGLY